MPTNERPLPSDSKVEWRKYAETLEQQLAKLEPKYTGFSFQGIPVYTDERVPPGEAHIRYHDVTVGKIVNIGDDFLRWASERDYKRLSHVIDLLVKALQRIRRGIGREPDRILVAPQVEYEPHEPGEFPRIRGESPEAYHIRYAVYQAKLREDEKTYGPQ